MKLCQTCKVTKPLESFFGEASNKTDGRRGTCKPCTLVVKRQWRSLNKPKLAAQQRAWRAVKDNATKAKVRHYGLTVDQFKEMLKSQAGVCKVCLKGATAKRSLCVDHDHNTGKVRGLLCYNCNRAMAVLDRPEWAAKLADYKKQAA